MTKPTRKDKPPTDAKIPPDSRRGWEWFKLFHEFRWDPKVQQMTKENQRNLVMIFLLRSAEEIPGLSDAEVGSALSLSLKSIKRVKALFIEKGFIDQDWDVIHWDERQYGVAKSTERTRRFREKHRSGNVPGTLPERDGNVSATLPERSGDVPEAFHGTTRDRDRELEKERSKETSSLVLKLATVRDTTLAPPNPPNSGDEKPAEKGVEPSANGDAPTQLSDGSAIDPRLRDLAARNKQTGHRYRGGNVS